MRSNPNPSLQFRSISDIISPYRNSFRDIDFRYVLSALISREEFLTRDFNLRSVHLEREQRRLRREINAIKDREEEGIRVLELQKDELSSKLEILKSSSIASIESNDRVEGLVRVLGEKDEEICRLVEKLSEICGENEKIRVLLGEFDGIRRKVEVLEKEKGEIDVKLHEFRRENECLVADKVKFDEELRKLELVSVGIKDEIDGLRSLLGEKNKEICGKDERIQVFMRRVEVLEKEKRENEVKFDKIRREKLSLLGDVGKFNEHLDKLKMEKSAFETELIEFRKENEYLIAAKKGCDEQLDKLKKEKSEVEIKLEKFRRENQRLMTAELGVDELLKKEKTRGEIKLEEFRKKNECLIAKMAKSGEELKSLRKERDGKIKEMKEKNDAEIESLGREKEGKIQELKKMIERLEIEKSEIEIKLEVFGRENERVVEQLDKLEKDKIQNEIKLEKFRRDNECLKAKSDEEMESSRKFSREMDVMIKEMKLKNDAQIQSLGREKEVEIDQLNKKIEGLEMEKSEVMEEKEELARKYEKMKQDVVKLEEDVARLVQGNVVNRKNIEMVLSSVVDVIDSKEDGRIDRVEKIQREVNTASGFATEVPRETKRRRMLSQWLNQKSKSDDTSDKSLNPCCKVKKAVDLSQVDLVHQAPTC